MGRSWILWGVFIIIAIVLVYLVSQQRLQSLLFRAHRGDERIYADVREMPWRSVVKLRRGASRCSGTMVAPDVVITAAHCLVGGKGGGDFFDSGRVFILSEYLNGGNEPVAEAVDAIIDKDYGDVGRKRQRYQQDIDLLQLSRDWAVLKISPALDLGDYAVPSPLIQSPSYDVLQAGYGRDSLGQRLRMDEGCRIFEHIERIDRKSDISLLRHNCLISGGDSGGPLFIRSGGRWLLVGINVAILEEGVRVSGYGVSLDGALKHLR